MWLKAPVMRDGTLCSVNKGTPQGGVISPLLANVYLHQVDEEWKRRGMTNRYTWNAQLVRYADDIMSRDSAMVRTVNMWKRLSLGEMEPS